jgi:ubiquinone/menaquinone biosynthesis C-methylase UbiE
MSAPENQLLADMDIDFGKRSDDYANARPGFPASFYERLERFTPLAGKRVLDLATGPGTVALELAARGAQVIGTDIAEGQLAAARTLAAARGLNARASFELAPAEAHPHPDASFDLITAGTCWHWFDHKRALKECGRLIAPRGYLFIAHYAYLPKHSPVAADSEALVLQLNPSWKLGGTNGLLPWLVDDVISPWFELVELFVYDHAQPMTHAAWRGRMRTCNGVGSGGMDDATVARYDAALAALLAEKYPEPLQIPHRVHCVVARRRG